MRRRQQAIDHPLISAGSRVTQKIFDLLRRRRQAGQIKGGPAKQNRPFGFGPHFPSLRLQFGQDKGIDGGSDLVLVFHCGHRRLDGFAKRPPVARRRRGDGCCARLLRGIRRGRLRETPFLDVRLDELFFGWRQRAARVRLVGVNVFAKQALPGFSRGVMIGPDFSHRS